MILYFSGTGNSRFVAMQLAQLSGDSCQPLVPTLRGGSLSLGPDECRLVWVFPVYSWGVPPYVREIIQTINLDCHSSVTMHAVMTCGDDCGMADRMWRRDVIARGWKDGAVCSVQMPNNYVAMKGFDVDPKIVEKQKLADAPARINEVAAKIIESERLGISLTDVVRGSWAKIKTGIIYPWFVRHAMSPSRFKATDRCIGCRKCAKTCPLNNITMTDTNSKSRPQWGNDCAGCLGCYHICPVRAVAYGSDTRDKGQYFLKDK